jgi:hypothetical protein
MTRKFFFRQNGGIMINRIEGMVKGISELPNGGLTFRNLVIVAIVAAIAYRIISKISEIVIDSIDARNKTPNLRNLFRQPYEPGLIKIMDNVISKATTDITFFGWRYISAPGYRDRIAMDEVADRIEWLSKNRGNITEEDLKVGRTFTATDKILNLYEAGDDKLGKMNDFSATLCSVRDCYFDICGANSYGWHKWNGHSVFGQ